VLKEKHSEGAFHETGCLAAFIMPAPGQQDLVRLTGKIYIGIEPSGNGQNWRDNMNE
jgi:hypothetical protein